MVIHNEIFDSYRLEQKKIKSAITLLRENNYTVIKKEKSNEYENNSKCN